MIIITLSKKDYEAAKKRFKDCKVVNLKKNTKSLSSIIMKEHYKKHNGHWGRKPLALDLERAILLRKKGYSYRRIAQILGCTHQTIYRKLKEMI